MIENLMINLKKRGFETYFCETKQNAVEKTLELIGIDEIPAFGGSETVKDLQIAQKLVERGNKICHRNFLQQDENREMIMRKSFNMDWFVASANALTENGMIVNTDGNGNRVAATIYGPKQILLIVGKNKIVSTLDDAFTRIKTIAAPLNCKRFNKNTPCLNGGSCEDCLPTETICKSTVIHEHPNTGKRFVVLIVNEELGF